MSPTATGYACERLGDADGAKNAYSRAGTVYVDACDVLAKSGGTQDDRSLHKFGEDALYRAAFWNRPSPCVSRLSPYHLLC